MIMAEGMADDLIENIGYDNPLQIELPDQLVEGKDFHIFISHSSKDTEWVEKAMDTLENEPYNLKCCYSGRDFIPGKSIFENIDHCVAVSMCTIVLLSPAYVESRWCEHEQNLASFMTMVDSKTKILPILLKQCMIPDTLKMINYLDANDGNIFDKIVQGITTETENMKSPYDYLRQVIKDLPVMNQRINGSYMTVNGIRGSCIGRSRFSMVIPDLTPLQIEQLRKMDIIIPQHILQQLIKSVNSEPVLLNFSFTFSLFYKILCFLVTSFFFLPLLLTIMFVYLLRYFGFMFGMVLMGSVAFCIVSYCIYICASHSLRKRRLPPSVDWINRQVYSPYKMLFYLRMIDGQVKLDIMKYDASPCKAYIEKSIVKVKGRRYQQRIRGSEGEYKEEAENIINKFFTQYTQKLFSCVLPAAQETRHEINGNMACLCQYIEVEHKESKRKWCFFRRKGYERLDEDDEFVNNCNQVQVV